MTPSLKKEKQSPRGLISGLITSPSIHKEMRQWNGSTHSTHPYDPSQPTELASISRLARRRHALSFLLSSSREISRCVAGDLAVNLGDLALAADERTTGAAAPRERERERDEGRWLRINSIAVLKFPSPPAGCCCTCTAGQRAINFTVGNLLFR
jgi:hypothetical protein